MIANVIDCTWMVSTKLTKEKQKKKKKDNQNQKPHIIHNWRIIVDQGKTIPECVKMNDFFFLLLLIWSQRLFKHYTKRFKKFLVISMLALFLSFAFHRISSWKCIFPKNDLLFIPISVWHLFKIFEMRSLREWVNRIEAYHCGCYTNELRISREWGAQIQWMRNNQAPVAWGN